MIISSSIGRDDALHAALHLLDLAQAEVTSEGQAQLLNHIGGLIEEAIDVNAALPPGAA